MKIVYKISMLVLATFLIIQVGCKKEEDDTTTTTTPAGPVDTTLKCDNITFDAHINRIFNANCGDCHMGTNSQGGVNFEGYAKLKTSAETGKVWGCINHTAGFKKMPPTGIKLSQKTLDSIACWRSNGYKQN